MHVYRFYLFGAASSPYLNKPCTRLPCCTLGPQALNSFLGFGSCANESGYSPCLNFSRHHNKYFLSLVDKPILSKSMLLRVNSCSQFSTLHLSCRFLPNELSKVCVSVNFPGWRVSGCKTKQITHLYPMLSVYWRF